MLEDLETPNRRLIGLFQSISEERLNRTVNLRNLIDVEYKLFIVFNNCVYSIFIFCHSHVENRF